MITTCGQGVTHVSSGLAISLLSLQGRKHEEGTREAIMV
jgi:hypothetical protein